MEITVSLLLTKNATMKSSAAKRWTPATHCPVKTMNPATPQKLQHCSKGYDHVVSKVIISISDPNVIDHPREDPWMSHCHMTSVAHTPKCNSRVLAHL